jgi:hypothetical protein
VEDLIIFEVSLLVLLVLLKVSVDSFAPAPLFAAYFSVVVDLNAPRLLLSFGLLEC